MALRRLAAALGVLRTINLRAIRRNKLRALLAAISLGGGVAVAVAAMIETTSVRSATDDVGHQIGRVAAEGGRHHRQPRQPPRHRPARDEKLRRALSRPLAEEERRQETNEQGG